MGAMLTYHLARKLKYAGKNSILPVFGSDRTAEFFDDMINDEDSLLSLGRFWQADYTIKMNGAPSLRTFDSTYFVEDMCLAFIQWLFNRKSPGTAGLPTAITRPALNPLIEEELQLLDDPFMTRWNVKERSDLGLGSMQLAKTIPSARNLLNRLRPFLDDLDLISGTPVGWWPGLNGTCREILELPGVCLVV